MHPKTNENGNGNGRQEWQSIESRLSKIAAFISSELKIKQDMIHLLTMQVQDLNAVIAGKEEQIEDLREKLSQMDQHAEGMRQLMNKLLNDIENYQKDIEWYQRTYEQRRLLGILKDKFFRK
jgi:chromosome segregation ATPase